MSRTGKAIHFSESALTEMAQISQADIEAAQALWVQQAPLRWKRLLESQTVGVDAPLTSPFVWDAQNRRYIDMRTRLYVPFTELRAQAIEPLISASKAAQRALGASLQDGNSSLSDWQRAMISQIKQTQLAAALAANGGPENSNKSDYKKAALIILALLLFMQGFARSIEDGQQALNGFLLLRSDLYASAARSTFEEIRRFGMATYFGAAEEKRELGVAEHCHTDRELEGCVELHDLGWQPINTLPDLGETPCRSNCRCRFVFRYKNDPGQWVVVDDSPTRATVLGRI